MTNDYQDMTEFEKEVDARFWAYKLALVFGGYVVENAYKNLVALVGEDRTQKLVGGKP